MNHPKNAGLQNVLEINTPDSFKNSNDWEYVSDVSLEQELKCKRCGMILKRKAEDDYGDWEYEKNNCCKQIIKCKRCGEILDQKIAEHRFGDWEFESYGSEKCIKVKVCLRCDQKKYGEIFDHDWVDLPDATDDACERVLECKRCKKEKVEYVHHSGIWEYCDNTNCDQVKKCSDCNEIIETRINPERFINYIKSRNIKYLLHFTLAENLSSIFSNGLLGRESLEFYKIKHSHTDDNRFDQKLDFISLSVSFPNYKMFFRKREELKRNGIERDWAILRLKPSILWEKTCLFFSENAATTHSKSIHYKNNRLEDFQKLFSDIPLLKIYRIKTEIADYYTTNPQAEVMVQSNIEPKYIHSVCFDLKDNIYDWDAVIKLRKKYKNIAFFFTPKLFRQRDDWIFWQKNVDNHIRSKID